MSSVGHRIKRLAELQSTPEALAKTGRYLDVTWDELVSFVAEYEDMRATLEQVASTSFATAPKFSDSVSPKVFQLEFMRYKTGELARLCLSRLKG